MPSHEPHAVKGDQCFEYSGPASPTGYRAQCPRPATWEAFFLGAWRPLCGRHVGQYSDLPRHRLAAR